LGKAKASVKALHKKHRDRPVLFCWVLPSGEPTGFARATLALRRFGAYANSLSRPPKSTTLDGLSFLLLTKYPTTPLFITFFHTFQLKKDTVFEVNPK
jgi:hypothetical protein